MTTNHLHSTRGTTTAARPVAAFAIINPRFRLFLLPIFLVATTAVVVHAVPLQYKVPQRGTECLYEQLTENEHVTLSVIITSGAELKGRAVFEGPIAPPTTDTGLDLKASVGQYGQGKRFGTGAAGQRGNLHDEITYDFETDADWDDDDSDDWEDDDEYDDDAELDDDREVPASGSNKSAKDRAEERNKRLEAKRKRYEEKRAAKLKKHNRAGEGDAIQRTYKAQAPGWYRACVHASWYQITAEIELRKESALGGIDKRTGHVTAYERRRMLDEEKELDDANADGLKDDDLKKTNDQLRRLNRLLKEIRESQASERHRLSIHAATNEHSHSRMVLSSLLETVLFMLITGFQVYTIRRWFSGSPMLGR